MLWGEASINGSHTVIRACLALRGIGYGIWNTRNEIWKGQSKASKTLTYGFGESVSAYRIARIE